MSVKASLVRDLEGFPVLAVVTQGAQKIEVVYEKDSGFTLSGSRRSLENQALINALNLIYPAEDRAVLNIPQPLQTVNVQGGKIILFDDMEGLLKWTVALAGGGAVALDNTNTFNGSQSLKVTCGAVATQAEVTRYFGLGSSGKIRLETVFAVDDFTKLAGLYFFLYHVDGTGSQYAGWLRYAPNTWTIGGSVATTLVTLPNGLATLGGVSGAWHKIALEIDIFKQLMPLAQFNGVVYKQPLTQTLNKTANGNPQQTLLTIRVDNVAGQEVNAWFDDVLITEA